MNWVILSGLEALWVIWLSLWIIVQKRSPAATIAWILGLSLLPIIGIPIYLFLGPRRLRRKQLRHAGARRTVAGALEPSSVCEDLPKTGPSAVILNQLVQLAEKTSYEPPTRVEDLTVYDGGAATYAAIEEAIRNAKHHVHVEYYIWEPDETGRRLRDALVKVASEGVEVRVLIDAFGSPGADRSFWAALESAGGTVAYFNPAIGGPHLRPRLINFRNHRKIVVCDGRVGFTGGINVSNLHTSEHSGEKAWRDTHLRIVGAAVRGLQLLFLEDWHFATGRAPTEEKYCPVLTPKGEHLVQVLGSGPDEQNNPIHKVYFTTIASARERVLVTTPYFVPDEAILMALVTSALRGVDVRLLLPRPELNDLRIVAAAARSYYETLINAGVKIFEYQPAMLHAKTLVMDDDLSIIGTANIDNRSFKLNFEDACVVYGEDCASTLANMFRADCRKARAVELEDVTDAPLRRRIFDATARLFSPVL